MLKTVETIEQMNEIKWNRLIFAGLTTYVVFMVLEIVLEFGAARLVFNEEYQQWIASLSMGSWKWWNYLFSVVQGLGLCTLMVWMYAALRPLYGVGVRPALLSSLSIFAFIVLFVLNLSNVGIYPIEIVRVELVTLAIEMPVSLLAGAQVYETGKLFVFQDGSEED